MPGNVISSTSAVDVIIQAVSAALMEACGTRAMAVRFLELSVLRDVHESCHLVNYQKHFGLRIGRSQ